MTTKQHMAGLFCGLALLALVVGCEGGNSTKNLTESSAKGMLRTKISADKKGDYRLSFFDVSQAIRNPTREDYTQGAFRNNDPKAAVQRLLRAGFITQSRTDSTVPNVSGKYKVNLDFPKNPFMSYATYTFDLSMQPTYSTVTGQYTVDATNYKANGPLTGTVSPDGTVQLAYGSQFGSTVVSYKFASNGQSVTLTGKQPFFNINCPTMTLTGNGPGGSLLVPTFSYSFSDKFKPLPSPNVNEIYAGGIEIDEVSNLLLATETIAQARFTWHVIFNDAAKALTGQTTVSGTGDIIFGKQPDGNWVLSEYHI